MTQELLTLREHLGSPRFLVVSVLLVFLVFCVLFVFILCPVYVAGVSGLSIHVCLHPVSCVNCRCLWIVHSCLLLRFSLMFIFQCITLLLPNTDRFQQVEDYIRGKNIAEILLRLTLSNNQSINIFKVATTSLNRLGNIIYVLQMS